jgi:hypothetical protein
MGISGGHCSKKGGQMESLINYHTLNKMTKKDQ